MFIKLTRLDNRPVWLNASFIVTVEPRRDGNGSIVVPIGDGLDYDVRESPAEVLKMLDGTPAPTVIPVPVSDCLTVSDVKDEAKLVAKQPEPAPVAKKPPKNDAPAAKQNDEPAPKAEEPAAAEVKPKKRATRTRKTTKKAKESAAESVETPVEKQVDDKPVEVANAPKPLETLYDVIAADTQAEYPSEAVEAPQAKLELSANEVARLRKMAPKSLTKLKNTLVTQFRITDVSANVTALAESGLFSIEGNRIIWMEPELPF